MIISKFKIFKFHNDVILLTKDYLFCIILKSIQNVRMMNINAIEDLVYINLWCAMGNWTVILLGTTKTNVVSLYKVFIETTLNT